MPGSVRANNPLREQAQPRLLLLRFFFLSLMICLLPLGWFYLEFRQGRCSQPLIRRGGVCFPSHPLALMQLSSFFLAHVGRSDNNVGQILFRKGLSLMPLPKNQLSDKGWCF